MQTIKTIVFAWIFLLGLVLASSCRHQQAASTTDTKVSRTVNVTGGGGTSFEDAVIIMDTTETTGVHAEYAWLKEHYPGYSLIKQSLVYNEGKPYDVMEIKTSGGKKKIYFDISNYFGKW